MTVTECTIDGGVRFDRGMKVADAYRPARNRYLTPYAVPGWPADATSRAGTRGTVHPRAQAPRRLRMPSRRRLAVYGAAGMVALVGLGAVVMSLRKRA
jgi:hypothetical protein